MEQQGQYETSIAKELATYIENAIFSIHYANNRDVYKQLISSLINSWNPSLGTKPSLLAVLDPRTISGMKLEPFVPDRTEEEKELKEIDIEIKKIFSSDNKKDRNIYCHKCRSNNVTFQYSAQLKGLDEGQTYFYKCNNDHCGVEFSVSG